MNKDTLISQEVLGFEELCARNLRQSPHIFLIIPHLSVGVPPQVQQKYLEQVSQFSSSILV